MAGKYDKNIKITVDDKGALKQKTQDINNLNNAVDRNNKKSGNLDRNMKGNARMSSNASKNFSKQAQGMQGVLVPAYAEVAARVFALTAAFGAMSKAADFSILLKGQEAYAVTTGKNMGSIAKSIQEVSKSMLDFKQASISAALATTAGLQTTQIKRMTKAALDASAALGRNMTDSMDRLTRGIVKAEPEILDEIGIIIRLDRVYKDYADSLNKTTAQLSEFEKLQARTNAILGQAEEKFGGIADTLPPNYFEKLGSAFLDVASRAGAVLSNLFGPFVNMISESSLAIGLISAMIMKSLIGQVFPAFNDFGKKFDSMTKKINKFGTASKSFGDKLASNYRGIRGKLKTSRDLFGEGFSKLGKIAGGDLEKFMAKGFKAGKALDTTMRSRIRAVIGAGLKSARDNPRGVSTVGRTKGVGIKELFVLQKQFKKIEKLQSDVGKSKWGVSIAGAASYAASGVARLAGAMATATGSLGSLVGAVARGTNELGVFKTLMLGMSAATNEKITFTRDLLPEGMLRQLDAINASFRGMKSAWRDVGKEATKTGKISKSAFAMMKTAAWAARGALGLVTTAVAGLVAGLGALTSIVGGFMMLEWVSGWFLDLSDTMGDLHNSLDAVNEALEEVDKTLGKRRGTDLNFRATIAIDFDDILKTKTFTANLTDQISQALDKAVSDIHKNSANDGWWGNVMDGLMRSVGFGASDKMAEALSTSITQAMFLSSTDSPISEQMLSELDKVLDSVDRWHGGTAGINAFKPILDATRASYASGAKITDEQIMELRKGMADALDDLDTKAVEEFYKRWSEGVKAASTLTTKAREDFKALGDSLSNVKKEVGNIIDNTITATKYDEMVLSYESALINMRDNTKDSVEQFSAIFDSGLTSFVDGSHFSEGFKQELDYYADYAKKKKQTEKDILVAKKEFDKDEEKRLNRVLAIQSRIMTAHASVLMGDIQQKGGIDKLLGFDPLEAQKRIRDLENATESLNLDLGYLKQFGDSSIAEEARTRTDILKNERAILQDTLDLAKRKLLVDKEGSATFEKNKENVERIEQSVANLNRRVLQTNRTAMKLSDHFHSIAGTTQTVTDKIRAMRKDTGMDTDDFVNWRFDLVSKELNEFTNGLDATFTAAQRVSEVMSAINEGGVSDDLKSNLRKKFKNAFPDEKSFKNIAKWVKIAVTDQGKAITKRMEVLNKEEESRVLTVENWGKHEDLLAYRERIAEMEREYAEEGLRLEYEKLKLKETQAAISVVEAQLVVEEWSALTSGFASAMQEVSDGFAEGVSAFVSSKLLGRDESEDDKWHVALRKTLSTGLATGVGDMVGKFAQQQVFGNKGFLSQGVGSLFGKDIADTLFPKTNQEKLRDALKELKDEAIKRKLVLLAIKTNTGTTAQNTLVMSGAEAKTVDAFMAKMDKQDNAKDILSKLSPTPSNIFGTTPIADKKAIELKDKTQDSLKEELTWTQSMMSSGVKEIDDIIQRIRIGLLGKEEEALPGHERAGYQINGFENRKAGSLAVQDAVTSFLRIPKDSIMYQDAAFLMQMAGKYVAFADGKTSKGTKLAGTTDGETQAIFLDMPEQAMGAIIHEAIHPLVQKLSSLEDLGNFSSHSSKSRSTMIEESLIYKASEEFKSKSDRISAAQDQFMNALTYKSGEVVDEFMTRGITQNSLLPVGTTPTDWVPKHIQDAMPDMMKDMDRLSSSASFLKELEVEMGAATKTVSTFNDNIISVLRTIGVSLGTKFNATTTKITSEFLKREYAKIEAAIAKKFPKNNNGKYVQSGQPGYDLPYAQFAKQQGQAEKAFRTAQQARAARTLDDAAKHEKSMFSDKVQAFPQGSINQTKLDFAQYGRQPMAQSHLFPQGELPLTKGVAETASIWSKLAPLFEKLNTTLMFLMPNDNIMDTKMEEQSLTDLPKGIEGALKVHEVNPPAQDTTPVEIGPKTAHQTSVETLLSGLLERTPMLELSNAALNASVLSSNGKEGATKVDIVNPEAINTSITDLNIAEDAKSAGKEGVRQLITAGHVDAQGIAQSVAGSLATKATDKAVDSIWNWASMLFADGGIAAGGFKAFASGGVVNQPTLGLVGEGKYNEAIVPLPDGKSIPVIGATGTNENNVTVNVTVDGNGTAKSDTQSGMDGDKAKQLGYMVSQAVQQELVQQQRPGGLLSQY